MKKLFFLFLLILLRVNLQGQTFSIVSANLQDQSNQPWSNATVTMQLIPPFGNPSPLLNQGHPVTDSLQVVTTNNSGAFIGVQLDDNAKITPSGSLWKFTMCPNATVAVCSSATVFITGTPIDLTSILSANLTVPSVFVSPYAYRAYNDTEAQASTGALYWRTTDNTLRGCVGFPCIWQAIGGGSGSGTVTQLNAGTGITLTPSPITTIGTISLSNQITAGSCTLCSLTYNAQGQLTLASSGSGSTLTGSGSTGFIPIWNSSSSLGNSSMRDSVDTSFPSGSVMKTTHSLYVSAENSLGTSCSSSGGNTAPFCVVQTWNTTDLSNFPNPFAAVSIVSGFNAATIPSFGSFPQLIALYISNGNSLGGTTTGTLSAQAGIVINTGNASSNETVTSDYGIYIQSMSNNGSVSHHYGLFMEDQTTTDNAGTNPVDPWGIFVTKGKSFFGSMVQYQLNTFSVLPTCSTTTQGNIAGISDSTVNTWGTTITGGGTNKVMGFCDGAHWTVAAI